MLFGNAFIAIDPVKITTYRGWFKSQLGYGKLIRAVGYINKFFTFFGSSFAGARALYEKCCLVTFIAGFSHCLQVS